MLDWPKISIVTPTLNQGKYIEETILSIIKQNYPNLEYIIIDGGSTDNTVEIIKKYEKHISYWVSEKDRGQAHAINKGLEKATGDIFQWINSDDYLEDGALLNIAKAFKSNDVDVVAGKTVYFKNNGFEEPIQQARLSAKGLVKWEKGVRFVQPGVWLKRQKIIGCGGIDEQFHYAFDWDMFIRYLSKNRRVQYIDDILVYFRLHDESKTESSIDKFRKEEMQIIEKILHQSNFKEAKKAGKFRKERTKWYSIIEKLSKENKPKHIKIANILLSCINKPQVRLSRITLGAIKNILIK